MLVDFECPKCKGHVCEIWALDGSNLGIRLMYWFMIWMPGLAFDELVLGQRTPSRLYVCKACELPFHDRTYVHCPDCHRFHNGRLWSRGNAFGHWLGLFCPSCGGEIPCLVNFTSRLVCVVTAPIWWLPLKAYRAKLIPSQQLRIARVQSKYLVESHLSARKPISYVQMGLAWALLMNVVMSFYCVLVVADWQYGGWPGFAVVYVVALLKGLMIWLPAGVVFALCCKFAMNRKGDKKLHLTYDSDGQIVPLNFDDEAEGDKG